MFAVPKPRAAVLGITLPFYEQALPDLMDTLQRQLRAFAAELEPHAALVSTTFCSRHDLVSDAVAQADRDDVDAIVVIALSYTASLMSLLPLTRTDLPLLVWNTQEASQIRPDYTFEDLQANHTVQGTQDLTNTLVRSQRVFGMETGHYRDAQALARFGEWLRAARACRQAKRMRVGLLGTPFQDMGDFGIDATMMATDWGPYAVQLSLPRYLALVDEASAADLQDMAAQDRKQYELAPDVTEDLHMASLRYEWALRRLVDEEQLQAFTMNFRDLVEDGRVKVLPLFGINKLLKDGLGYAGEGNITIAAHMAQMRQLCGTSNFTEIYTIDFERNRMMMTHMQECNPALARRDRKVRLVRKPFWAPGIADYVGMHFTVEPGPVTLTNLTTDPEGRFYYIAREMRIVDMEPLPAFDAPHWMAECDEPISDFLTDYGNAGGTHHLVAVPGHHAQALRKLAHLQGFRFIQL